MKYGLIIGYALFFRIIRSISRVSVIQCVCINGWKNEIDVWYVILTHASTKETRPTHGRTERTWLMGRTHE